QGLGDQIIYSSMVPDLVGWAETVVLEVEPRLVPLFSRSFPQVKTVAVRPSPQLYAGQVDAQAPLGSIGRYVRTAWQDFPRRDRGYLAADAARARALRQRLAQNGRAVVGLSWISRNPFGRSKSAALAD